MSCTQWERKRDDIDTTDGGQHSIVIAQLDSARLLHESFLSVAKAFDLYKNPRLTMSKHEAGCCDWTIYTTE